MKETCPICIKSFSSKIIERHVNSCLDNLEEDTTQSQIEISSLVATPETELKSKNAFAALGLIVDTGKSINDKSKKTSATLTSILLAEKRLKRRQEELEDTIRKKQAYQESLKRNCENSVIEEKVSNAESEFASSTQVYSEDGSNNTPNPPPYISSYSSNTDTNTSKKQELFLRSHHSQNHFDLLQLRREAKLPLAQRLRPRSLDDFYGQERLVGPNGILRNLLKAQHIPSFILWGVPGVGKTSLARIIASSANHRFVELSGSDSNAKQLKEEILKAQNESSMNGQRTILFLDEIHRFNKAVQDLLLPVIEKGLLTVIGATTENPSFTLNNALLSRLHTFVMEPLPRDALVKILSRGLLIVNRTRKILHKLHLIAITKDAIDHIASLSCGDSRVALNILESVNAYLSGIQFRALKIKEPEKEQFDSDSKLGVVKITLEKLHPLLCSRNFYQMYDKTGDNHYDTISAFHKSVRGSNADAAVFYLAKMLRGGEDPLFIARRMVVIASEDIGLRDSSCLPFAIATMEAVQFIGMPEGEIVMGHCAVKLARAPKSTKSYRALRKAQALLNNNPEITQLPIPMHLRNAPTGLMKELGYGETYRYNPNFKHGLVKQSYLPVEINNAKFVDDFHFGTAVDDEVLPNEYERCDHEEEDYEKFKTFFKLEQQNERTEKKATKLMATPHSELVSSPIERLASYDENLSRLDQPEYFDGIDGNQDTGDDNSICSYDELLKEI